MKIKWCFSQGMKLIEPNERIANDYYRHAEETLRVLNLIKDSGSNMWIATQKYYSEYLAAYSILMKIGIKSEIHSCTIEIIRLFEDVGIIDFGFSSVLESDKDSRIDNQYYLKDKAIDLNPVQASMLLLKVRKVLDNMTNKDDIERIREHIQSLI